MTELPIQVEASPTFNRNLRTLAKKYRNIQHDIQPVIEQLKQGEYLGDRIPGVTYEVFKLRVRNSDAQKGKSGGYRLLYSVGRSNQSSDRLSVFFKTAYRSCFPDPNKSGFQAFRRFW